MAVHGVNIMYSTCNGSNDEFKIDYGGLSLEHTIDQWEIDLDLICIKKLNFVDIEFIRKTFILRMK